ncbi:MAG: DUF4399 domain-containing protein [Deltaproteobacteria bacterium]|nr:MAG: DUF4399 domain-containing protein [Deltaproteobacteria bacterium]
MTLRILIPALLALAACPSPADPPDGAEVPAETQAKAKATGDQDADPTAFTPLSDASVHFIEPQDGAEVRSPVKVVFGLKGATVKPAGELKAGTGHHHLILDGEPTPKEKVVPADDTHIHYGKGQTEADVELEPGEHTLIMQFADGLHRSYGPDLSAEITITVIE